MEIVEETLSNADKRWLKLMKLGASSGCHQRKDRSFSIKKYQFPICARCTGLLFGQLAGIILYILGYRMKLLLITVLLIPLIFDGFIQLYTKYESNNTKRVITGFMFGCSFIQFLIIGIVEIARIVF